MSGEHRDLVQSCASSVQDNLKVPFRALLLSILSSQYVVLDHDDERCWQVKVGSGMGLVCSGEVSDVCFIHWQSENSF